jgi:hypothetical protein
MEKDAVLISRKDGNVLFYMGNKLWTQDKYRAKVMRRMDANRLAKLWERFGAGVIYEGDLYDADFLEKLND